MMQTRPASRLQLPEDIPGDLLVVLEPEQVHLVLMQTDRVVAKASEPVTLADNVDTIREILFRLKDVLVKRVELRDAIQAQLNVEVRLVETDWRGW